MVVVVIVMVIIIVMVIVIVMVIIIVIVIVIVIVIGIQYTPAFTLCHLHGHSRSSSRRHLSDYIDHQHVKQFKKSLAIIYYSRHRCDIHPNT